MLEAWSDSQLFTVLLSIGHGELRRCWRGARLAVCARMEAILPWEQEAVCQSPAHPDATNGRQYRGRRLGANGAECRQVINTSTRRNGESSHAEHRLQRPSGAADPDRRRLGDHQYLPELRLQREKTALDSRGVAAAAAGFDPVVFPGSPGRQDLTAQCETKNRRPNFRRAGECQRE